MPATPTYRHISTKFIHRACIVRRRSNEHALTQLPPSSAYSTLRFGSRTGTLSLFLHPTKPTSLNREEVPSRCSHCLRACSTLLLLGTSIDPHTPVLSTERLHRLAPAAALLQQRQTAADAAVSWCSAALQARCEALIPAKVAKESRSLKSSRSTQQRDGLSSIASGELCLHLSRISTLHKAGSSLHTHSGQHDCSRCSGKLTRFQRRLAWTAAAGSSSSKAISTAF